MTAVAVFVTTALLVAAGVHALWAARIWWPVGDEVGLARAVVGSKGIDRMPGQAACAFVTVFLIVAALWSWIAPEMLRGLGLTALALVFLGRGIATYMSAWQRRVPEEPFARNDRLYYGPLCLAIGACFAIFLVGGWT